MTVWGLHHPAAHGADTQAAPAPARQAHVRQNLTPGAPRSKPRPLAGQHKQAVCVAAVSADRATLRRDTAQTQCVWSPAHALQREGRNVLTPELAWGGQADAEHARSLSPKCGFCTSGCRSAPKALKITQQRTHVPVHP